MDEIVRDHLEGIAKQHRIRIYWVDDLDKYTPPCSLSCARRIVMNNQWHNEREIPFQLAHEIGHVLLHSDCDIAFYHATYGSRVRIEREANSLAISLLLPLYFRERDSSKVNANDLMECLSIPAHLEGLVRERIKDYLSSNS
ncbi:ImmA/IrrE family metallo-endopeptidase [Ligilactobacillus sp. LYQ139]|uniref:ImmA/IrrE family metallo-endopeptidase n=1 Tax=Ligilactobacillus sp. LYQ139 TaxID=3378800 RepID=UPI0038538963